MPTIQKVITFMVKHGKENAVPKWRDVTAENATCPDCKIPMTVVSGKTLYAHCCRCGKYFVAE